MTTPLVPTLVVIRGNSGSGKSSAARQVRARYGRGAALIGQDEVRREMLREHGSDNRPAIAPGFIAMMARSALAAGYHVVLEGILHTSQNGDLLRELIAEHRGPVFVCWFQVSFDETVRRHQRRPAPIPVTVQQMRDWYTPMDLLGVPGEQIIEETSTFEQTVTRILHESGLGTAPALTPCPTTCPRCAAESGATGAGQIGTTEASGSKTAVHGPFARKAEE